MNNRVSSESSNYVTQKYPITRMLVASNIRGNLIIKLFLFIIYSPV